MNPDRRRFLGRSVAVVTGAATPAVFHGGARADAGTDHERTMRLAVEQARKNPEWPFGAVIIDTRTGDVLASGVNDAAGDPMLHGEVAAMNDYVRRHGNQGWADTTLYTTGEPCPMCMSAMAWANLRRVVWASSVDEIRRTGIPQFDLTAQEVAASAKSFYAPQLLLGGVLAPHTNRLFQEAQQLRGRPPRGTTQAGCSSPEPPKRASHG